MIEFIVLLAVVLLPFVLVAVVWHFVPESAKHNILKWIDTKYERFVETD